MPEPDTYSSPRYLKAKRPVDQRSLNRRVWSQFLDALTGRSPTQIRILEVGGGIGATVERIIGALENRPVDRVYYTFVDITPENVDVARTSLRKWARGRGYEVSEHETQQWTDGPIEVIIRFITADLFDIAASHNGPFFDALVGQAVFDLLPIPKAVRDLRSVLREDGLWYLPLHFDGVTAFEPPIDPDLDGEIQRLYHESMSPSGQGGGRRGSVSGRHLLSRFQALNNPILAAGASDWVVFPRDGAYPADVDYFLHHILHFVESELSGHPDLDAERFADWVDQRHRQVDRGELIYIAHQLDLLARNAGS